MVKASKWFAPYFKEYSREIIGKGLNKNIGKQSGVYLIKDSGNNKVVYCGHSKTQLYKTIYRHFQQWNDRQQERIVFDKKGFQIRIILCTPSQCIRLETYLINKLKPKYNKNNNASMWTEKDERNAYEALLRADMLPREDIPF